ncbi:MAG: hypothetical protein ABI680_03975 [Chthoniobacteraceae bacterium]
MAASISFVSGFNAGTRSPRIPLRPGVPNLGDGIYIQSRRQGAETWDFLAIDTSHPYKDERPNLPGAESEWRKYRACCQGANTPTRRD